MNLPPQRGRIEPRPYQTRTPHPIRFIATPTPLRIPTKREPETIHAKFA
ncbi:MAG: hypothetical protein HXX08_23745 [Chloroflexi bacterium]|uniref:Uncharacterized protein n=1 Tax=Candidatus Chlorohelix allophototropha TaxID=3003348 RepID=A0A8T7M9T3_9CHLR|nr:hypothetical protein [Chloroflexota bacterium]WJW68817.1 hypothetical protein OZ401_004435 [Chloroflexota bacterium L227-S17]